MAWSFIKNNWETIHGRYSSGGLLTRLVKVSLFKNKKRIFCVYNLKFKFRYAVVILEQ